VLADLNVGQVHAVDHVRVLVGEPDGNERVRRRPATSLYNHAVGRTTVRESKRGAEGISPALVEAYLCAEHRLLAVAFRLRLAMQLGIPRAYELERRRCRGSRGPLLPSGFNITDEVRMGRVLPFTRPHNASTPQARYPRFTEVAAHIDQIADEVFGTAISLEQGANLYGQVEERLAADDRELLAKLYEATLAHEEKFEHAAYLVGLMAGSGQLPKKVAFLDQRMSPEGAREGDIFDKARTRQ
jgi:hypothetical protein